MILEVLLTILTFAGTYKLLRSYNVPKSYSIMVSIVHSTLPFIAMRWTMILLRLIVVIAMTCIGRIVRRFRVWGAQYN